jgi:hypothetical protein
MNWKPGSRNWSSRTEACSDTRQAAGVDEKAGAALRIGDERRRNVLDMGSGDARRSGWSCYVYADAEARDVRLSPVTITIERREDGFHVTAHPDNKWAPRAPHRSENLIPVASIMVKE